MCNTIVEFSERFEGKIYKRETNVHLGDGYIYSPLAPRQDKNRGRPVQVIGFIHDKDESLVKNASVLTTQAAIEFTDTHEPGCCDICDLLEVDQDTENPKQPYVIPALPDFLHRLDDVESLSEISLQPEYAAWLAALIDTTDSWLSVPKYLEDVLPGDDLCEQDTWTKGYLFGLAMHGGCINGGPHFPENIQISHKFWMRMAGLENIDTEELASFLIHKMEHNNTPKALCSKCDKEEK